MAERDADVSDLSEFRQRRSGLPDQAAAVASAAAHPGEAGSPGLPTGTVTFLLTDIEGSTRSWESHAPEMAAAVARHYQILDGVVSSHGGLRPLEQGEGDSLVAVFTRASDAAAAAIDAQRALAAEAWPSGMSLAVRMALHTGDAELRDDRYYTGATIIRCARLRALAHGGQVLLSGTTADLLAGGLPDGAALVPLGVHRLRDLRRPEEVFQLSHPALPGPFPPLRGLLPHNLPVQLTSFVGRDAELLELSAVLVEHRLLTLTGAAGCGKTRLGVQLAADVADRYADGVWWADLAPVSDPERVPWAIMAALGLGDDRGLGPIARLTGFLADQRILLLVDNCEHVLIPAADVLHATLRACPNVTVITTSREPLGVPGEVVWRVAPLSLPGDVDDEASPATAIASEAVRLFADRAIEARPTFRVDAQNVQAVAAICRRLDGLPLAIELAAARVRSLAPQRILDGLTHRFRLLTGGARTAVARQQTLQASVEWSHHLLSDREAVLFRRLAAFSGGFTLEAAESVAATEPLDEWDILGLLSDLVDKSLVVFDGDRYRLLQTIHDFARDRLLASGEADAARNRHLRYYLETAEAASAQLEQEVRADLVAALEADHDNLRAALEWSAAQDDGEVALRLVVALTLFWLTHGHFSEGLSWHRRVLASIPGEPSALRCRAVWGLGHLSLTCLEVPNEFGLAELQESLALARQLGDPSLLARTLADHALVQVFLAPDDAPATLGEAIDAARRSGDEWAASVVLWWQAFYWVFVRNEFDRAEPVLAELDRIGRRVGNVSCLAWNDIVAGIAAWQQGRLRDARAAMEQAREAAYRCGDPLLEMHAVDWQIEVRIAEGDYGGASALAFGAAVRLRRSLDGCRQGFVEFGLAQVALALGDLTAAAAQADMVAGLIRTVGLPSKVQKLELLRGRLALAEGDLTGARAAFSAASELAAQTGTPWMRVEALHGSALADLAAGDRSAAEDRYHEALALDVRHGFRGIAAETLEGLASLAVAADAHAEATRLFGAADAVRRDTGQARWPLNQPAYDAGIAALRAAVGDDVFTGLWQEGAELSLDDAASYATRARGERRRPRSGWAALTPTELNVVAFAARGLTNAEIGGRLFISPGTVRIHLSHIYAKLGLHNRTQLAAEATARGVRRPDHA